MPLSRLGGFDSDLREGFGAASPRRPARASRNQLSFQYRNLSLMKIL